MFRFVLGTHNPKKLRELEALLAGLAVEIDSLDKFPKAINVDETGTTFVENARLKATQQARHLGQWVLAEDSGLSVPGLGGAPGVYSARYAGPIATDAENNAKLMTEIRSLSEENRSAYYTCQLCFADPTGILRFECSGLFHGRITETPLGDHGFGYDPLFIVPEYHKTVAQLGAATKSAISHRAQAIRCFRKWLTEFLVSGSAN